jgi:hypothetical protein
MSLSEDQLAKIILIRSVEECDPKALPENVLAEAFNAAGQSRIGVDWLEKRASYLFERLSTRYQSVIELAKAPAQWTVPFFLAAFVIGLATNLLGPAEEIHVVRNPVFFLLLWNFCVYLGLLAVPFLPRKRWAGINLAKRSNQEGESRARAAPQTATSRTSWPLRFILPRLWHFFQRMTFGFRESKAYGDVVKRFSMNWLEVGAPLSMARWKAILHLGALGIASGAIGGMYARGLLQDYRVSWASTFITREESVDRLVHWVFGPSLFVSRLLGLGIEDQISVARLLSPDGDDADGWIHLFALTVALGVVIPRALLALWQRQRISQLTRGLTLVLDSYYGPLIESPIRSLIDKQIDIGAAHFAAAVAKFVGTGLYENQIVPRLRAFRQHGGKIGDLKADLQSLSEAFLPALKSYIAESAAPAFQKDLSVRVGELIRSIGADFSIREPAVAFDAIRLETARYADTGIADPLSAAVSVSFAASISLAFATVGGGIGSELGIAIISTLLGTTGPVGFVIGLLAGALAAGAVLWLGKESLSDAIMNLPLPAAVVKSALWQSRFQKLIDDGREQCEESVRVEVGKRLKALQPEITDRIMSKARSLWG